MVAILRKMRNLSEMKITATELARNTGNIVDQVVAGRTATLERHGKPMAELRAKPGISGRELAQRLRRTPLKEEDARRLRAGCQKANQAFADGHRD
jgi:antitoxin (DNA-binding transcriptional repressor) of toxin-antitoxin stability system